MQEEIREIIKNSELYYTAKGIIDEESFKQMIDELVEELSEIIE